MESDMRFYRRRANEELAAASRAITEAARERRMQLAGAFLARLQAVEGLGRADAALFDWDGRRSPGHR